jgi:hypothetical protein
VVKDFMRPSLQTSLICSFLSFGAAVVHADVVRADVPLQAIQQLVNSAKILHKDYRVSAVTIPNQPKAVLIKTWRAAGASDTDCKIDALLMSSKILSAYHQLSLVRVQTLRSAQDYLEYDVTAGEIVGFGKGGLEKDRLLTSLIDRGARARALQQETIIRSYILTPGYASGQRQAILTQIQTIQTQGVDPMPLWKRFLDIEEGVKEHQREELVARINQLTNDAYETQQNSLKVGAQAVEAARLRQNELVERQNLNYAPHPGYFEHERQRISQEITRQHALGTDVKFFQTCFINGIEQDVAFRKPKEKLKQEILQLEQKMNMSPQDKELF